VREQLVLVLEPHQLYGPRVELAPRRICDVVRVMLVVVVMSVVMMVPVPERVADQYLRRVGFPQRQLVTPHAHLYRVAERGDLAHGYLGARRQAHVDQAPLYGARLVPDGNNYSALPGR